MTPKFLPLGDCGVRIAFGSEISPAINARIRRFGAALDTEPISGMTEWVCSYAVVTVYYKPWIISYDALCTVLTQRLRRRQSVGASVERLIEIPVCYGGELGPDLEEVAARHGLTAKQVIQKHSRPRYRVYFLGFLPGFAYLGGLTPSLATPRRATARSHVPAGAVGIAGEQTGVYPAETPGGWQIIGRTPLRLYDSERETPALLAAGDQVRFVPISLSEFDVYEHTTDTLP
ncbi:MAG: 5-oxoprolinase subunit PxpB [Janthinobacterium lividum]